MLNNRKRTLIFINIMISCIASSMLATALTTALPTMVSEFHVSVTTGQWLTSGYSLAMAIMMPLTAFLIIRFPTRKLYLTAIALFIAGLLLAVLAPNFPLLMTGRILQACGNGILSSMAQVILLSIYPLEKRGSIMGWYGLSIGAAPVIAPTITGILIDISGWRLMFYIVIAIMALSFVWALRVFDNVLENRSLKFDTLSFILSALAYGGLTLGVGNISTYSLISLQGGLPLLLGLISMIFFSYRQFHLDEPFLDLSVLKNKIFIISLIGSMLLYFIMYGSSILLPLLVQSVEGYSATISGLVTLPGSLAMTIISPFTGRFYDKFGMKKLFLIGALALLLSNLGMVFITMKTSLVLIAALNAFRSISIGCLMMPLVTWGMSHIDDSLTAHGTALLTSLRTIAGAIGSAVFVGIMTITAKNSVKSYGENASIHGLNVTFLWMALSALLLVLFAFFSGRSQKATAIQHSLAEK